MSEQLFFSDLSYKFIEIQDKLKPELALEIGAYDASFSQEMKEKFPDIISIAFEANTYNYEHWTNINNYAEMGVIYESMAISDVTGEITFSFQDTIWGEKISPIQGNNSILQRTVERPTTYRTEIINSFTLDDYLHQNNLQGKRSCAWIDVEGASREVFMGAEKSLDNIESIFIEVEHHTYWENQWLSDEVQSFLESKGFVFVGRDRFEPTQENYMFVRENQIDLLN